MAHVHRRATGEQQTFKRSVRRALDADVEVSEVVLGRAAVFRHAS